MGFSLAIIFEKVQIVAIKVVWQYQYSHYLCNYTYLDDMKSNVKFFFAICSLSFELFEMRKPKQ